WRRGQRKKRITGRGDDRDAAGRTDWGHIFRLLQDGHGIRPWEAARLTYPQVKMVLGWDAPAEQQQPRGQGGAQGEEISWAKVQQVWDDSRNRIFTGMRDAAGVTRPAMRDLPIDEAERLYLKVTGHAAVDRVKL